MFGANEVDAETRQPEARQRRGNEDARERQLVDTELADAKDGHERKSRTHDQVNAIACGDNVTYIATDGGLGIITYEPYTMRKKAAWYEAWLESSGQKRLGLIHRLFWRADRGDYVRFLGDNDLGWACHYLDALCYKYAVTKDPAVRAEAVHVFGSESRPGERVTFTAESPSAGQAVSRTSPYPSSPGSISSSPSTISTWF